MTNMHQSSPSFTNGRLEQYDHHTCDWQVSVTTTEIFNCGGQNRLTVAGKATATDERPQLIVALTMAVAQPPRLIC